MGHFDQEGERGGKWRRSLRAAARVPAVEVQQLFKRHFHYTPTHTVSAPGRLELLGAEAEGHEGLGLSFACNRYLQVAASPRQDGKIELVSGISPKAEIFWLSQLEEAGGQAWAVYARAVLQELRRLGAHFGGFNAAIHSQIPMGQGWGASSALVVALALMVRNLYPFRLTETGCMSRPPARDEYGRVPAPSKVEKAALARVCHRAESRVAGGRARLADSLAILFGKGFHLLVIDARLQSMEAVPFIGEIVVVACGTGVKAVEGGRHREAYDAAARKLGARSLRSVDLEQLTERRMKLSDREYGCAYHVLGETKRIIFAERALQEGDWVQLGQYLWQSHESGRDFLQLSYPEAELLVELARGQPSCLGARLTSAPGGPVVSLVSRALYEDFLRAIPEQYEQRTGRRIEPIVCQLVEGAQ